MNKIYKTAIVGGGAAGLLCAVELLSGENALRGEDVVILERNDRVGKKLIATGNGQGNLSNARISAENYSGDADFVSAFVKSLGKINIAAYFGGLGVITDCDAEGRIYPVSRQANSVLDIIRAYLSSKNCTVITGFKATDIVKDGVAFEITAQTGEKARAQKIVLAAGGKAAKQFGTDGSAYLLAEKFGHKITPLYPSLVQLKTERDAIRGFKGIKERAKVSLYDGDTFLKGSTGDLLFTDYGVSGNAVFKVSDKVASASEPVLKIEFIPDISETALAEIIEKRAAQGFIPRQDILNGIVHKKIGESFVKRCGFNAQKLAFAVKNFRLKVVGNAGFDSAQVTKGGVDTRDISPDTYESKLQKGLFIVGETLDVDGECGGYNLTFAFVSGALAARAIKNGKADV